MEEHSPSRDHAHTASAATLKSAAPEAQCDLCGWPMAFPKHCIEQGEILGLLVCSLCIEDHLQSEIAA